MALKTGVLEPQGAVTFTGNSIAVDHIAEKTGSHGIVLDNTTTIQTLTGILKGASGVVSALALGTANQKLFIDAAGTAPEFAQGYKIGTFTRDIDSGSGDASYTSVGFKPSKIIFFGSVPASQKTCLIGFSDANINYCMYHAGGDINPNLSYCMLFWESGTQDQAAIVKSFNSDGFTITWTLTGSPTPALIYICYMAFR